MVVAAHVDTVIEIVIFGEKPTTNVGRGPLTIHRKGGLHVRSEGEAKVDRGKGTQGN